MNRVVINGQEISVGDPIVSIRVNGSGVFINGKRQDNSDALTKDRPVDIKVEGNIASLECDGGAEINGNVLGSVASGGGVHCGDVGENVQAGGGVHCGKVSGNVQAGGGVHCD